MIRPGPLTPLPRPQPPTIFYYYYYYLKKKGSPVLSCIMKEENVLHGYAKCGKKIYRPKLCRLFVNQSIINVEY
jgi:hypothetical protein